MARVSQSEPQAFPIRSQMAALETTVNAHSRLKTAKRSTKPPVDKCKTKEITAPPVLKSCSIKRRQTTYH